LHPIVEVGLGEFRGLVWRHMRREHNGALRFSFDVTVDNFAGATSNGQGDSPERLASLLWSVADELAELQGIADAMQRHPAGRGH
jgi:hypothetical protein